MKRNTLLFVFFFVIQLAAFAQALSPKFYKNRREAVRQGLPDSSFALLFSAPTHTRSNDVEYLFHQDPDFFYLTGITYSDAFIVLFKNPIKINNQETNEVLFIHNRNPKKEILFGAMPDTGFVRQNSGIHSVLYVSEFMSSEIDTSTLKKMLFKWPKGVVDIKSDTFDLFDLLKNVKEKFKTFLDNSESGLLIGRIADLRSIKQPEEITAMRKAISISCDGHSEMMKYAKPGLYEYNVQAVGEYIFRSEGAETIGYPSICGAGANSCTLHYDANRSLCTNGSLLLLDMGAEYNGYSADVTRTIPVNGKFTESQKAIYQVVFDAQEAAFRMCAAGNAFRDPHKAAVQVIKKGLKALGIIDTESAYDKYFMHGTSHYLGLDVHDAGNFGNLKVGNVITVEPGIYIPEGSKCDPKWWNIGVRIEDDVLITKDGYEILSGTAPRKPAEIESLMSKHSLFNK